MKPIRATKTTDLGPDIPGDNAASPPDSPLSPAGVEGKITEDQMELAMRCLLHAGLISEIKPLAGRDLETPYVTVETIGKPLSEIVIEDRR